MTHSSEMRAPPQEILLLRKLCLTSAAPQGWLPKEAACPPTIRAWPPDVCTSPHLASFTAPRFGSTKSTFSLSTQHDQIMPPLQRSIGFAPEKTQVVARLQSYWSPLYLQHQLSLTRLRLTVRLWHQVGTSCGQRTCFIQWGGQLSDQTGWLLAIHPPLSRSGDSHARRKQQLVSEREANTGWMTGSTMEGRKPWGILTSMRHQLEFLFNIKFISELPDAHTNTQCWAWRMALPHGIC